MADVVDQAQAREEHDRELALAACRERVARAMAPRAATPDWCIDCEEPIEPERLTALRGCTSRCAQCAHDNEARLRHG